MHMYTHRYEEDNLIRLPQKNTRDLGRDTAKLADDLTDFSGLEALTRDFDDEVCVWVCLHAWECKRNQVVKANAIKSSSPGWTKWPWTQAFE